jgi:fibronectin-binding autotransporter adhesin
VHRSHTTCLAVKVFSVTIVLALTAAAHAQILRWDSSGANPTAPVDGAGNWNTTDALWSNTVSNVAWDNTSKAYFGNFGAGNTVTINQGEVTTAGINFNPVSAGTRYTIAGDSSNSLKLTNATINIDVGQTPIINAPITGTVGLSAIFGNNTGTLTLGGSNTYTGSTTIDGGGTLIYTADNSTAGLFFGTSSSSTTPSSLNLTNANLTVTSLTGRTSSSTANTITIGATKTLTVSGAVTVGFDPLNATQTTRVNVTGDSGNTMVVNAGASSFFVGGNSSGSNGLTAIVDMSGLSNFTFTGTEFNMGGRQANTTGNRSSGQVTLANTTNSVTATTINVGAGSNSNGGGSNFLHLGAGTNAVNANSIFVGTHKSTGTIDFASGTGSLVLRNQAGTGRAALTIGQHVSSGTASAKGNLLFNGHAIDVLASTMTVGELTSVSTSAAVTSQVQFDQGTIDVTTLTLGQRTGTATGTANATLTMGGGNLIVNSPTGPGGGTFTIGNNTSTNATASTGATGTFTINGGTADVYTNILRGANGTAPAASSATINLQGGTLDMHGFAIGAAGATNSVTFNAISGTLQNLAQINGGAGLSKTGAGTLNLNSTFYSGLTTVVDGTLTVNGRILDPFSGVSVDSNANADGLLNLNFTGQNVVSSLSIGGVAKANGLWGSPTSGAPNTDPLLGGTGILNVGGTVEITRWTGAHSSEWSTAVLPSPKNWTLQSTPTAQIDYTDGDRVLFDDNATNTTVSINSANVTPFNVEFNNTTKNYTLDGTNGIAGFANVTLTKNGSGTVILANPNSYGGTTTINAGTLQIGNGGSSGTLGTGSVVNNANLTFNRNDAVTIANTISGTGSVNYTGSGTTTIGVANTYSGATSITAGIVKITTTAGLGTANGTAAAGTTINGGTFDINGIVMNNTELFRIQGTGAGGVGAIINTGAGAGQNHISRVTLTGNATIGGSSRWDFRGNTPNLDLAGFTLNKIGANQISLVAATVTDGNIVVDQGTFSIETTSTVAAGTGSITYNANTNAQFFNNTGNVARQMIINAAGVSMGNGGTGTATINSPIELRATLILAPMNNGAVDNGQANRPLTLGGNITESGGAHGLTKTGLNSITLSGTNTYTGDTTINGGTLTLGNSLAMQNSTLDYGNFGGSLSFGTLTAATLGGLKGSQDLALINTTPANVALSVGNNNASTTYSGVLSGGGALTKTGSGTFTLTGDSTYTGTTTVSAGTLLANNTSGSATGSGAVLVNSGATLGGTGSVSGAVTVQSGGKISPGASIESVGVGKLTLDSESLLTFELGAPTTGDLINVADAAGLTINGGIVTFLDAGGLAPGTYPLITYNGALGGALGNLTLGGTQPSGFSFNFANSGSSIDVVVASSGGSANYDGLNGVDTADYVLWRKTPSAYGGDPAGYNAWRGQYGNPSGAGAGGGNSFSGVGAVPEPNAILLACCAMFGAVFLRSRGVR